MKKTFNVNDTIKFFLFIVVIVISMAFLVNFALDYYAQHSETSKFSAISDVLNVIIGTAVGFAGAYVTIIIASRTDMVGKNQEKLQIDEKLSEAKKSFSGITSTISQLEYFITKLLDEYKINPMEQNRYIGNLEKKVTECYSELSRQIVEVSRSHFLTECTQNDKQSGCNIIDMANDMEKV